MVTVIRGASHCMGEVFFFFLKCRCGFSRSGYSIICVVPSSYSFGASTNIKAALLTREGPQEQCTPPGLQCALIKKSSGCPTCEACNVAVGKKRGVFTTVIKLCVVCKCVGAYTLF